MQGTILTGIKPTGIPHIGNLMGAIRPAVDLAKTADKALIFIADLHSLNSTHSAAEIAAHTNAVATALIASGVDFENTILFRQSDVPEVSQLAMLLMNVTAKGHMNRAHAYKDSVARNVERGEDADVGINMGLYTYPILMAADILLYGADAVPVGQDQKQHVEFARDIANSLNKRYGMSVLKDPKPVISAGGAMLKGTDGRKMSKSYDNTISLFATENEIDAICKSIKTDSRGMGEPKEPETVEIYQMYRHFATEAETANMAQMLREGAGYGQIKPLLADVLKRTIAPYRALQSQLEIAPNHLEIILNGGAGEARKLARETLRNVHKAMLGR